LDVLRIAKQLTTPNPAGSPLHIELPQVLFEDRENHLYLMTPAPAEHAVWKAELLSGLVRSNIAEACGVLLASLHSGSWHNVEIASRLDDRQFFDELRIDPYYREIARAHPDLAQPIENLINEVWSERHCLVHGDFSPKNLLVTADRLVLIDFEVGHYGDPAFDLGFFLAHLVLKAFFHAPRVEPFLNLIDAFWAKYLAGIAGATSVGESTQLIRRSIQNLAACTLARLDGKSKVDYLTNNDRRAQVRRLCSEIFSNEITDWHGVAQFIREFAVTR
jgi:5-methylthioribose kinase